MQMKSVEKYRIMGIDPGTNYMGYGVLEIEGRTVRSVVLGDIDLHKLPDPYAKLRYIFERVGALVDEYAPREVALESPFFGENVQSMLKLGRAQGVAMAAALSRGIDVFEYAPMRIKQSITGRGSAAKEQVASIVCRTLAIDRPPKRLDATDGMAVALCHYFTSASPLNAALGDERVKGLGGGKKAASKGGSQIWLKEGEQMTVDELLKATAVYSANDACTALGEYLAGSDEAFVKMMNDRAEQLGMTNTHFENCTGLDDTTTEHLTTAADVAIMSRELLRHELITNYTTIWMDSLRDGKTELVNTNKLVRFYQGTTGLKTGTTAKAGCCVSASAMREGTHLVAVVMGSGNSSDRFETAKAMLNWGFANYSTVTPKIDPSLIPDVGVINGVTERITPRIPDADPILIEKGRESEIAQKVDLALDVAAPVEQGQVLGTVTFTLGGEELGKYSLTAPDSVPALTFGIIFRRILASLCGRVQ